MKFRLILSIVVCKCLILVGKLIGKKGSSTPGQIALKICPNIIELLSQKVKNGVICTLGTNGKTTTNNMINMIFEKNGEKTVCNRVGANMIFGVATAFAQSANIFGNVSATRGIIEIDEASAKKVFKFLKPTHIVITNLFRDQLDRYGEIDITIQHIKTALLMVPDAILLLNCDDPLCNYFSYIMENKVVTYGISQQILEPLNETKEGRFCQLCGQELSYNYYHYSQLGDYFCPSCDFKRSTPDFSVTDVLCNGKISFTINGEKHIKSNTYGFYNIYNILAAIATFETVTKCEKSEDEYSKIFCEYEPQIARMEEFKFEKPVILNLSKNPAGFNQAITTIQNDPRKKAVVVAINDNAQDGYDISWLYDVDFEKLKDLEGYGVFGKRKYDMALRLFYADVCKEPKIGNNAIDFLKEFLDTDAQVIYFLVNYTLIFEVENQLKKELKNHCK